MELRGSGLEPVRRITFLGRAGPKDNVRMRPSVVSDRRVQAMVPALAKSGPIGVVTRWGATARTRSGVRISDAPAPVALDLAPGSRFFYDGRRKPSFVLDVSQTTDLTVELLHGDTGEVARSWTMPAQAGQRVEVRWDGNGDEGVERTGSYRFRLGGAAAGAASIAPGATSEFLFADHLFPIRGRHNLGYTSTNQFGGGRGHQGIDMFARCGTRLAAARGGRVQYAGYHARAGYYAVIDGRSTGIDYVYMHMNARALVSTGQRVVTGQKIGEVGDSGNADGCHTHFETWAAPGWYEGGKPFDPKPLLTLWDSYS